MHGFGGRKWWEGERSQLQKVVSLVQQEADLQLLKLWLNLRLQRNHRQKAVEMPAKSEAEEKVLPMEEAVHCCRENEGTKEVAVVKDVQSIEMAGAARRRCSSHDQLVQTILQCKATEARRSVKAARWRYWMEQKVFRRKSYGGLLACLRHSSFVGCRKRKTGMNTRQMAKGVTFQRESVIG